MKDPIKSISEYRTSTLYENLSFAETKSEKYSSMRELVATAYSLVNKLSSLFLQDEKSYTKAE